MHRLTERELQSLRNLGNECEAAADRIEHLERVLVQAREALESCSPADYSTGHVIHASFDDAAVNDAIDAIDSALHTEVIEKR